MAVDVAPEQRQRLALQRELQPLPVLDLVRENDQTRVAVSARTVEDDVPVEFEAEKVAETDRRDEEDLDRQRCLNEERSLAPALGLLGEFRQPLRQEIELHLVLRLQEGLEALQIAVGHS